MVTQTQKIFPKQDSLADGNNGSGINAPYHGGDKTDRYAIDPYGNALSLDEFFVLAESLAAVSDHA